MGATPSYQHDLSGRDGGLLRGRVLRAPTVRADARRGGDSRAQRGARLQVLRALQRPEVHAPRARRADGGAWHRHRRPALRPAAREAGQGGRPGHAAHAGHRRGRARGRRCLPRRAVPQDRAAHRHHHRHPLLHHAERPRGLQVRPRRRLCGRRGLQLAGRLRRHAPRHHRQPARGRGRPPFLRRGHAARLPHRHRHRHAHRRPRPPRRHADLHRLRRTGLRGAAGLRLRRHPPRPLHARGRRHLHQGR